MASTLTARSIETFAPRPTRVEIPDALLTGLYLIIQPRGGKSWAVRFRILGKSKKLTLGKWPAVSLKQAREFAREALRQVAEGHDPTSRANAAGLARIAGPSVEDVAQEFIARHLLPNTRPSTAKEMTRLLRMNVLPLWRGRLFAEIAQRDVVNLIDGVVDRGAAVSANRTFAVLRKMFRWAGQRGIIEASPCDRLVAPTSERSRERVLRANEIAAFWGACDSAGWPFGPLAKLLLLTGQRRDEVGGLTWAEIDLDQRMWTIPRSRVKNDRDHHVPLSPAACSIIVDLPRMPSAEGLVFTTNGQRPVSGFSRAKSRMDAFMASELEIEPAALPEWRLHDLRRTAATGMARLGVDIAVVEKVLNHQSGTFKGIVNVYQRHSFAEEKRDALDRWGDEVIAMKAGAGSQPA